MVWRASVELLLPTAAGRPPAMAADLVGMIRGVIESIRASCQEVPICARLDPSEPKRFRLRPRDAGAPALATRCPSVTGRHSYSTAMRLEHDPEAASWLDGLAGDSEEFDWDDGTKTKHAKHGVEPAEIKALFRHPLLFAGRIVEPSHPEPRWLVLGMTDAGRHLALIFTRRGDTLRPISGRPMRRKEGAAYEEACRQDQASAGSPKR